MEYSFISFEALPFVLPLLVCAIIFCAALYGHLNFKHIQIKNISMVASIVTLPLAIFLIPLIIKMAFDYNIPLPEIHGFFAILCFILAFFVSVIKPKSPPSILQIIGLSLFVYGAYSFLA